jgi:hypothetical protein
MNKDEMDYWIEHKCEEKGCYNVAEKGYIFCIPHLHGTPSKLPEEVIKYLKERGECQE